MEKLTMVGLAEKVPDEAAAYEFMERLRWKRGVRCPHCSGEDCRYLNPENGKSRRTRTGATSARRVWQCRGCRKQFSVLTGTVMHGTKIPVRTWLFVMFEMSANKNGIAAREVERRYGLCPKSAWFMLHRLRETMANDGPFVAMGGPVMVADETWIGGNPRFRHRKHVGKQGQTDKTPVLSLIDKASGEVRSRVVPDVTGSTLRQVLAGEVELGATVLHTDMGGGYVTFGWELKGHERVNHSEGEYVRGTVSTNLAEGFFSQLKRSLDGTHHHVSREHLGRYLGEFDFRYSTRGLSDTERMEQMVAQTDGVRLSYRPLVGA